MARRGGCESAVNPLPTPFLTKTYHLVDDHTIDDLISWSEDGSSFVVWNQTEFSRDLLPKYFKHNNFSSFVRQLNTYGFRKVVSDRWEFSNDCFRRGEMNLLSDIQRRKIVITSLVTAATPSSAAIFVQPTPAVTPLAVSPSDSGEEHVLSSSDSPVLVREFNGNKEELIGENERLRKQNVQLNKELYQMKNMCHGIYNLMSNFSSNNSSNGRRDYRRRLSWEENPMKPLDLLPTTRFCEETDTAAAAEPSNGGEAVNDMKSAAEELSARLFGVPIGLKRGREGESGTDLRLQQAGRDIKSEPLDEPSSLLKRSSSRKFCSHRSMCDRSGGCCALPVPGSILCRLHHCNIAGLCLLHLRDRRFPRPDSRFAMLRGHDQPEQSGGQRRQHPHCLPVLDGADKYLQP